MDPDTAFEKWTKLKSIQDKQYYYENNEEK